jgi:hypothetical protein
MFTFMQSATVKLASKFAPHSSPPIGVVLEGPRQLYDREFYKELVMRLYVVKAQNRTVFGRVRIAGLDVLSWFLPSVRSSKSVNRRRKSKKPLVQVDATLSRTSSHCP